MPVETKQVSARIPKPLYDKCNSMYDNMTIAVTTALELLIKQHETSCNAEETNYNANETNCNTNETSCNTNETNCNTNETTNGEMKASIEEYKTQVTTLNAEISRLKTVIMEAPDPVDLVRLQERNDGLNLVIAEKEKRIEELTEHKKIMNRFADYFSSTEPKQIEASAAERKKTWWRFW